jgi:hypothetical protein
MTAFELNEELKERCILLGAKKTITTHFKEGVPLLPEPFWETIVIIPLSLHKNYIKVIYSLINEYMQIFEKNNFFCAKPVLEFSYGEPRIIYAIFPEKLSFTKKLIKDV